MNHSRIVIVASLLGIAACQPKASTSPIAQDSSPPVATVNGTHISRGFFDSYIKAISGKSTAELTPEQRSQALDNLIRAEVVAQHAVQEGLDKNPDTATMLELTRLNVLQQATAESVLKGRKVTEQELRAEYENELAGQSKTEYHVKHILVATEPFAQKIVQRLEKGEKFDELARRESMDTNKDNAGDLGWLTPDNIAKPFAEAVVALKPGEFTRKPVQTPSGWHVIELVEQRDLQPASYDSVHGRLEQIVQAKKVRANTDELMRSAKIEKKLDTPMAQDKDAAPGATDQKAGAAKSPEKAADKKGS